MRALLVLALLCSVANAKRMVIRRPPVATACPTATSWASLHDCLSKHGLAAKELSTVDTMKLIAVVANDNLEGFALYLEDPVKHSWHLGGLLQESGDLRDYAVVKLERVSTGTGVAYRFDVAASLTSSAAVGGVISKAAIYRSVTASFCHGNDYHCSELVPKCEQIVDGQTLSAFDGSITVKGSQLSMRGTGTEPGCSAAGEFFF